MTQSAIRNLVFVLAICMAAAASAQDTKKVDVDVKTGPRPGTRESVTVFRPGPGGETQVISKEVVTDDNATTKPRPSRDAVTDDTPRKARVVVVPAIFAPNMRAKVNREFNEKWGLTDRAIIENPGYTSHLIDALVNTRKLDVLEREDLRSVTKELDFADSDYVDLNQAVKIGKMLNADFVVIPLIRNFGVTAETRNVPYVGQSQTKLRGRLGTSVRTVNVATSKIIASHIEDLEKYSRMREKDDPRITVTDLITSLYNDSSIREAANIVDVAYPIKIMSITGDTVIVNRGRGAIVKDEVLKVYEAGEVMLDPDTQDNLGYTEAYVGSIKIIEVNEKISKGVIVEQKGDIKRLSICRRDKAPTTSEPVAKPAPRLD